jgi:hypothetical protein
MDQANLELLQTMIQQVLDGQTALRDELSDMKGRLLSIKSAMLAFGLEAQSDIETPAGDPAVAEDEAVRARVLGNSRHSQIERWTARIAPDKAPLRRVTNRIRSPLAERPWLTPGAGHPPCGLATAPAGSAARSCRNSDRPPSSPWW